LRSSPAKLDLSSSSITLVIGFAPQNVVLARDFFRVGLPAGDWSACDSECTPCALRVTAWVRVGPNLLGQGIVLSANKTASASREHLLRSRSALDDALNAVGLFARRTWAVQLTRWPHDHLVEPPEVCGLRCENPRESSTRERNPQSKAPNDAADDSTDSRGIRRPARDPHSRLST